MEDIVASATRSVFQKGALGTWTLVVAVAIYVVVVGLRCVYVLGCGLISVSLCVYHIRFTARSDLPCSSGCFFLAFSARFQKSASQISKLISDSFCVIKTTFWIMSLWIAARL